MAERHEGRKAEKQEMGVAEQDLKSVQKYVESKIRYVVTHHHVRIDLKQTRQKKR